MRNIFVAKSYTKFAGNSSQIHNQAIDHLLLPNIKFFSKSKICPCLIFCIIFKEKYFPWDIVLTDQISLSGCL